MYNSRQEKIHVGKLITKMIKRRGWGGAEAGRSRGKDSSLTIIVCFWKWIQNFSVEGMAWMLNTFMRRKIKVVSSSLATNFCKEYHLNDATSDIHWCSSSLCSESIVNIHTTRAGNQYNCIRNLNMKVKILDLGLSQQARKGRGLFLNICIMIWSVTRWQHTIFLEDLWLFPMHIMA